jgi:hypothetical protein
MRCKFFSLKVIFIDEISMVGKKMFNFINLRLQEIKGSSKPFGGVSVVVFGDLFQLKPVMDSWIFSQPFGSLECLGANLWADHFSLMKLNIFLPTIEISSINITFKLKNLHLMESNCCISRGLKSKPFPTGIAKVE